MKAILCITHFHGSTNPIRYLYLLALCLMLSLFATASPYYWVGGSGNWNDMSHWSATSGGPGFAYIQAPTQSDDVFLNQNSFTAAAQTITVNVAAVCRDLTAAGSTNIYFGAAGPAINITGPQLDVLGNFSLAPNMRPLSGTVRFINPNGPNGLDFKNVTINGNLVLDALNGSYSLASPLQGSAYLYITRGTLITNNYDLSIGSIIISGLSAARGLILGSSRVSLFGTFTSPNTLAADPTLVINFGSSVFNLTNPSPIFTLQDYVFNRINVYSTANPIFDASISNSATVKDLIFYQGNKANFSGKLLITDSLVLLAGNTYTLSNISFTSTAAFICNGTCGDKIELLSGSLTKSGGWAGYSISNCIVVGVQFGGGFNMFAAQSYDRGGNTGISFAGTAAIDYYWVGGSGTWNDGLHWAATSGGIATSCVPGPSDNVFFDALSFTAPGQSVNINDSADAWCANMNWTGATNNPSFKYNNTPFNGTQLYITGSLTEIPAMTWNVASPVNFNGGGTIKSAGHLFQSDVIINTNPGSYAALDTLKLLGKLQIGGAGFYSNNYDISCSNFTSNTPNIDLGISTISISNYGFYITQLPVNISGSALPGFSQCTFRIKGMIASYINGYNLPSSTIFHNFFIENPSNFVPGQVYGFNGSNNTFDTLGFESSVNVTGSNTIKKTLKIGQGIFVFPYNFVTYFNNAATISKYGIAGCTNIIQLQSNQPGSPAYFNKTAGTLSIDFAKFYYMGATGGAGFTATNSTDLGGTVGWSISNSVSAARTLYWVGNSGNWNSVSNWSLTSGGMPGECVPTNKDSTVFDAGSFSLPGQTVTIDIAGAVCKAMNWTGATNNPKLTCVSANSLSINGSLILTSGMILNAQGPFTFTGTGNHIIQTAGKALPAVTINASTGTYGFADNFITNTLLTITSGTLNTNSKTVTTGAMTLTGGRLNMGSTYWTTVDVGFLSNRAWYVSSTTPNAVNAGTSTIKNTYYFAYLFDGGPNTYNIVDVTSVSTKFTPSTFNVLRMAGSGTLNGVTINDSLSLAAGGNYFFTAGSTTRFADTATFYAVGNPSQMISLESTTPGVQYNLQKNTGLVCTDFLNLWDSKTAGTAIFTAGANTIDRGNNNGWDFTPYPAAGNGFLVGGIICGGGSYALRFDITAGNYPMDIILRNLNTGKRDTLFNVMSSPVYFMVSPLATNNYQVQKIIVNRCSQVVTGPFNTVSVAVPGGAAGQWTNAAGTNRWLDCGNWGNGTVPDMTTNVIISGPAVSNIDAQGAVCRNLTINLGAQLVTTANSSTTIYGNISNSGTFNSNYGRIELAGAAAQTLPPTVNVFDSLVISNSSAAGVTLSPASNITVFGALVLNTGKLNTGTRTVLIANTVSGAVSGYSAASYVNGNITRAIDVNSSYDFPVGSSTQYELANVTNNNLAGVSTITGRFDPFALVSDSTISPKAHYLVTGEYANGLLDQGYWTLTPDAQPVSGDYKVTLRATGYTNPATQQFRYILVKKDAGTGFKWDINQGYNDPSLHTEAAGVVTAVRSSYTSFSNFAIAKLASLSALATQLQSFGGMQVQAGNRLTWSTASEEGQTIFIVERSKDGLQYAQIEKLDSRQVNGYAIYMYTDQNAGTDDNFYRLRVILPGGESYYSKTITLKGRKERNISLIANASAHRVQVYVSGSTENEILMFRLSSLDGRELLLKPIHAGNNEITVHTLPAGVYVGQVISSKYAPFVKQIIWKKD